MIGEWNFLQDLAASPKYVPSILAVSLKSELS